jgi:CheY-like chemotaxis protein
MVMQFGFKLAMLNQLKILIVDDEEADRNTVRRLLRKFGIETEITEALTIKRLRKRCPIIFSTVY